MLYPHNSLIFIRSDSVTEPNQVSSSVTVTADDCLNVMQILNCIMSTRMYNFRKYLTTFYMGCIIKENASNTATDVDGYGSFYYYHFHGGLVAAIKSDRCTFMEFKCKFFFILFIELFIWSFFSFFSTETLQTMVTSLEVVGFIPICVWRCNSIVLCSFVQFRMCPGFVVVTDRS